MKLTFTIMSTGKNMLLYWGSGSAPCWRPMIVLAEKDLTEYESKLLNFSQAQHKSEEIVALNPRGQEKGTSQDIDVKNQIPTFKHGDIVVNESKAICLYLESQFKKQGVQLIPDDYKEQALVLQKMYESDNIQINGIRKIFWYHVRVKKENIDQNVLDEKYKVLSKELLIWENYLSHGFQYLCSNSFTMADIYFFTYLAMLVRGSLPFEGRPNLKRYYDFLSQRPSIKDTWPPHFKETPPTSIYAGVKAQL